MIEDTIGNSGRILWSTRGKARREKWGANFTPLKDTNGVFRELTSDIGGTQFSQLASSSYVGLL